MLDVTPFPGSIRVRFSGQAGANYQVLRSTDLTFWTPQTTITMPVAGVYTYVDNTPPNQAAYYRVLLVP